MIAHTPSAAPVAPTRSGAASQALSAEDVTFEAYLRALPAERVFERLASSRGTGRRVLSSSAVAELAAGFRKPGNLVARFHGLSSAGRRLCAWAYLLLPRGVEAAAIDGFDDELLNSFLVHAARDADGRLYYRGFGEFVAPLTPAVDEALRSECRCEGPAAAPTRPPVHVLNDAALAMAMAGTGQLQQTRTGSLAKAAAARCRALLHCARSVWRADTHTTIQLYLDYGTERGVLGLRGGERRLRRAAMTEWTGRSVADAYADLRSFCMQRVQPWHWELACRAFADVGPGASWYRLGALSEARAAAVAEGLRLGEALGLFAVVKVAGEVLFRAAAAELSHAPHEGAPTLQPDYSAVISQEAPPATLCRFRDVGDLHRLDNVYHGRVTREAVAQSLAAGIPADDLLSRLRTWHAPANVLETVREWAREFGRLCMPQESLVLVSTPEVAAQLRACDALSDLVALVPAGGALRIRPGHEPQVRRILADLGFDTRTPALADDDEPEDRQPDGDVAAGEAGDTQTLVTRFEGGEPAPRSVRPSGKYGAALKALPPSELDHVVDYAILMGHQLRFEYEGSPWVKAGVYTIVPLAFTSGADGAVEGQDTSTGSRRRFLRGRIRAIGVMPE